MGHTSLSLKARCMAAILAGGPTAVLSHRSAADLWDLRRCRTRIEITVPRGKTGPASVQVHQSRRLCGRDVTVRDGIPVTTVERTLLDLAAVLPIRDLAKTIDRAERLELFDLASVEEILGRSQGVRGAAALQRAIAAWSPRHTWSELEDLHFELVSSAGLDLPQLNVPVEGERYTHVVDAYWPDRKLVVQLDGFVHHRTRRDRERDAGIDADLELAGNRVVRLTWGDVTTRRARTLRRYEALLA